MKIKSTAMRRMLWYGGILIFLAMIMVFQDGRLALGFGLFALGCLSVWLSLDKLVCPKCGKAMRRISVALTHCSFCGTPYESKDTAQPVARG